MEAKPQGLTNTDDRVLWSKCEMFYGTSVTNFMCSKWFKEESKDKGDSTIITSNISNSKTEDVNMVVEATSDTKPVEEEKVPEKPIQVCPKNKIS